MQNSIKLALASIVVGTIGLTAMPQANASLTAPVANTSKSVKSSTGKPALISLKKMKKKPMLKKVVKTKPVKKTPMMQKK